MDETITVNWEVSITSGTEHFTLEELGCESIEEWNDQSEDDQRDRIQEALDELPDRTCIIVDTWQ